MNNNMYNPITWEQFYEYIKLYYFRIPKTIDDYADMAKKDEKSLVWYPINEWKDMEYDCLLKLLSDLEPFRGELLVATEVSWYPKLSPFKVKSENIIEFTKIHLEKFKECFFDEDVVIISFEVKSMWIFHHEGVYTLVKFR